MNIEKHKNAQIWVLGLLVTLAITALSFNFTSGCGRDDGGNGNGGGGQPSCDGLQLNETVTKECPRGYTGDVVYLCTENGLKEIASTCAPISGGCEGKALFEGDGGVQNVLSKSCASAACHANYTDYNIAKSMVDAFVNRINLPSADSKRMPRYPNPELTLEEKELIGKWKLDGTLKNSSSCSGGNDQATIDLNYIESNILSDLTNLDAQGRANARYLILAHKANLKVAADKLRTYLKGAEKGINSVSLEDDIALLTPIDSKKVVYRADLRAYALNAADWEKVLQVEPVNFESFTRKGLLIKNLSGSRKVWLHADNFTFVTHFDANLYYDFTNTAANRNAMLVQIGSKLVEDLNDYDATLMGFNGSPISNQKNRVLLHLESGEGSAWLTYDTIPVANVADRNAFDFPLLAEVNGATKVFRFDAQELIYTLPNGLQGYALFNANGGRENVAPFNIVRDTVSPFSPEISNALSCHRCHSMGLIPAKDQIRSHVVANASRFERTDVDLVKALYKSEVTTNALFGTYNKVYAKALGDLGILATEPDPLNALTDDLRKDYNVDEVAAFVFLPVDQFKQLLSESEAVRAQIGQLLTGGTITFQQLLTVMPVLLDDFRLNRDPFGEE